MPSRNPVIQQIMEEQYQGQITRKRLFIALENQLDMPIVSYFTSFRYPVMVEDSDADMLEGLLQRIDLSRGLALVISSPGGDGMAAERIINVCRSFSDTGEFVAIVPGKAKSAATMVCFGASKIYMGASSELGPIDPQWFEPAEGGGVKRFSVFNIVESYDQLFAKAVRTKGNLHPYLQQLKMYDEREIKEFRAAIALSEDIAIRSLSTGMMSGMSNTAIKRKIDVFLSPKTTKAHGRPIYRREAQRCGLTIEPVAVKGDLWKLIYELYLRTNNLVNTRLVKCIESRDHEFGIPVQMLVREGVL